MKIKINIKSKYLGYISYNMNNNSKYTFYLYSKDSKPGDGNGIWHEVKDIDKVLMLNNIEAEEYIRNHLVKNPSNKYEDYTFNIIQVYENKL